MGYYNANCSDQTCQARCCNTYGRCPIYNSSSVYQNRCQYYYSYYGGGSSSSSCTSTSSSNCCYSRTSGYYYCSDGNPDLGAIVGGVVGGVVGLVLIIVGIVCLCRRFNRPRPAPPVSAPISNPPTTTIIYPIGSNYGAYGIPIIEAPYGNMYPQSYVHPVDNSTIIVKS